MNVEPWVTAVDVARHLGVVKDTVYCGCERKGLPAHKIGRLWKFQLSEVDEWEHAGGADEDSNIPALFNEAKPEDLKKYKDVLSAYNQRVFVRSMENQQLTQLRDWLLPLLMNGQVTVV